MFSRGMSAKISNFNCNENKIAKNKTKHNSYY